MAINTGEEPDLDKIAEDELARLQRQYRIMEMERATMCSAAKPKLRKQQQLLAALVAEHARLALDLRLAKSAANLRRDASLGAGMADLLDERDQIVARIGDERLQLAEMEALIAQVERETLALKAKQISEKEECERATLNQQKVSQLENRLEVVTKKFNSVNAGNFHMREEIDHLLRERTYFNLVWNKTLNILASGKSLMMELVEQSTMLYDQREEWCHKLQNIKERAQYDQVEHTHEMGELQRKLDHDSKLQQFLSVKGSVRVLAELEAKEAARRRAQRDRELAIQERYKDILKQIQEFSKETDVERLTTKFTKQDEENYALFNYVNEVNHELEILANSVSELKINLDNMREEKLEREAREQESLDILKNSLKMQQEKTAVAEKSKKDVHKQLTESLNGIQDLYNLMDCAASPILQLLSTKDINIHNVMLYLKTIEKKTLDVVNCAYYAERVKKMAEDKNKPPVSPGPMKVKIAKDAKGKAKSGKNLTPK